MKISDYPDLISDDEEFSFLIAADWLEEQNRDYESKCLQEGYVFSVWLYFFNNNNIIYMFRYGNGYSVGTGTGYGAGYGAGDGAGYGDGHGYGAGTGDGDAYGDGTGHSDGYGDGTGYGNGYSDNDDFGNLLLKFFAIISQNVLKL